MKEFTEKITKTQTVTVASDNTAKAVKSGSLEVFATPMMLSLMEAATCKCADVLLENDETTVGTSVSITHDKASGIGRKITAFATLEEVQGRKMIFSVYAKDDEENIIGKGQIERFVVLSNRFMEKVNSL